MGSASGAAPSSSEEEESAQLIAPSSSSISSLPPDIRQVLEKLPRQDATGLLSFIVSRSTTNAGPDPETARIMADSEMHEEDCKLKAFQSNLDARESQSVRDHDFRKKKLNHASLMSGVVILASVLGVAGGLTLTITGNPAIGNPVLIASFTMLSSIAGKLLSARDKD